MNQPNLPTPDSSFPDDLMDADGVSLFLGAIVELLDDAFSGLTAMIVGWGGDRGLEVLSEDDGILREVSPVLCRVAAQG
ncbi:MAG: hypothetical protein RLZZ305_423 [Actinomycetota bacterium]|jgi:hypothetical protein